MAEDKEDQTDDEPDTDVEGVRAGRFYEDDPRSVKVVKQGDEEPEEE